MGSSDCLGEEYCNGSKGFEIFSAFVVATYFLITFVFFSWLLYHFCCCWIFHRLSSSMTRLGTNNNISTHRELREMLPIIVFKESFQVKDSECSVCLGEYQPEDQLKQIPLCGHTFHMHCIDRWMATHTTCPLCRLSLSTPMESNKTPDNQASNHDTDNHSRGAQYVDSQQGHQISGQADLEV